MFTSHKEQIILWGVQEGTNFAVSGHVLEEVISTGYVNFVDNKFESRENYENGPSPITGEAFHRFNVWRNPSTRIFQ